MTIATLPSDWTIQPLGVLCGKPEYGLTETASNHRVGPRFLRITDIQGGEVEWHKVPFCRCSSAELDRHRIQCGDLLVARIGATTGKTFFVRECPEEAVFASYLIRLRPSGIHDRYLYYFCQSPLYWEHINAGKDERLKGGVNISSLTQLPVVVPPLPEQVAMANALESIESAAQNQRAIAAKLGVLKEATTAKLFREGLGGEPLKETAIGAIPESWEVVRLGDVARITTGTTPSTERPDFYEGTVPFVKTAEIDNQVILGAQTHVSPLAVNEYRLKLYPPGTVFLAMYGQGKTRGRAAILGIAASTTQNTAAIECSERLNSLYLWHFLLSRYEDLRGMGNLGHLSHLNLGYVKELLIPLPSSEEQARIGAALDLNHKSSQVASNRAAALSELFRVTLQGLVTGEIRVTDVGAEEVANA